MEQYQVIRVKQTTKQNFKDIQTELQNQNPDLRVNEDYVQRKLQEKFIGDLQWMKKTYNNN